MSGMPAETLAKQKSSAVCARDVLAMLTSKPGLEAFQLARRLNTNTSRLKVLLGRMLVEKLVVSRRDKYDSAGNGRLCFYPNPDVEPSESQLQLMAEDAVQRHVEGSSMTAATEEETRPHVAALTAADQAIGNLLSRMTPGESHSIGDLARITRMSMQRVTALIQPLIHDGRIVRGIRTRRGGEIRYRYYLGGTEPQETTSTEAPPERSIFARPAFDREYGRELTAHRDLCNARRSKGA